MTAPKCLAATHTVKANCSGSAWHGPTMRGGPNLSPGVTLLLSMNILHEVMEFGNKMRKTDNKPITFYQGP